MPENDKQLAVRSNDTDIVKKNADKEAKQEIKDWVKHTQSAAKAFGKVIASQKVSERELRKMLQDKDRDIEKLKKRVEELENDSKTGSKKKRSAKRKTSNEWAFFISQMTALGKLAYEKGDKQNKIIYEIGKALVDQSGFANKTAGHTDGANSLISALYKSDNKNDKAKRKASREKFVASDGFYNLSKKSKDKFFDKYPDEKEHLQELYAQRKEPTSNEDKAVEKQTPSKKRKASEGANAGPSKRKPTEEAAGDQLQKEEMGEPAFKNHEEEAARDQLQKEEMGEPAFKNHEEEMNEKGGEDDDFRVEAAVPTSGNPEPESDADQSDSDQSDSDQSDSDSDSDTDKVPTP